MKEVIEERVVLKRVKEKVTLFETEDGQKFEDVAKAKDHEESLLRQEKIKAIQTVRNDTVVADEYVTWYRPMTEEEVVMVEALVHSRLVNERFRKEVKIGEWVSGETIGSGDCRDSYYMLTLEEVKKDIEAFMKLFPEEFAK